MSRFTPHTEDDVARMLEAISVDSIDALFAGITRLAETEPDRIRNAPNNTPVSRPDEVKAARELRLTCRR
jgi:glycine cleavage system pyridoxal-binding protein P